MPSPQTLVRRSGESPRTYFFDFTKFPELLAGDTLASVVSVTATPAGLTFGTPSAASGKVSVQITGGADRTTYLIRCIALTSGGSRLEVDGYLLIQDPD